MIGLDTNVLVRLLTADEPVQLASAQRLLAAHEGKSHHFFINDMVLVELTWVLKRLYDVTRDEALGVVASLAGNEAFAFEDRDRLLRALAVCRHSRHDFPDALIALKNASVPCEYTATFDRATRGLPSMRNL